MYGDAPRLTAHLAVFDVVLFVAAPWIERDRILFATIRTHDGPNGVRSAVAKWKVAVEVEFVVGESHTGSYARREWMFRMNNRNQNEGSRAMERIQRTGTEYLAGVFRPAFLATAARDLLLFPLFVAARIALAVGAVWWFPPCAVSLNA